MEKMKLRKNNFKNSSFIFIINIIKKNLKK